MKCNWWRWLWGIVPLLVLSWVAVQAEQGRVERDLSARARVALIQSGLGWATAEFDGRDSRLTGRAPQESEPAKALDVLSGVWGVRVVENSAGLIEKADKYQWSAGRRGNRIRLSGHVPSANVKQAILGVAKVSFPGHEVVDRMTLARGVPSSDVWLGGVSFALKQLASLKRGDVRLEDLNLSVSGEAEDVAAYRAMKLAFVDGLPKGIKIVDDRITPPVVSPFTWAAKLADGRLSLSGYVPSEAGRAELIAAARAGGLPADAIADEMTFGDGAPQGWAAAAAASLRALSRLESGSAEFKDTALAVAGVANDQATAEAARDIVRAGLSPTLRFNEQIRAKELPLPPPPVLPAPVAQPQPPAPTASEPAPAAPAPPPAPTAAAPPSPAAPTRPDDTPKPPPVVAPQAAAPPAPPPPAAAPTPPRVVASADPRAKPCEDGLTLAASEGKIQFRLGSADLDAASFATLDRLAQAAKSCPGMLIEVGGHASAEGGAAINRQLSVRRARSVVAYMVRAGVGSDQLEAIGFGTSQPVAPNDSDENMAKNRRIELKVRPK